MVPLHEHTCCRCGYKWPCLVPTKPKVKKCPVDVAITTNKSGPFCDLCRHMIMAKRIATLRQLPPSQVISLLNLSSKE